MLIPQTLDAEAFGEDKKDGYYLNFIDDIDEIEKVIKSEIREDLYDEINNKINTESKKSLDKLEKRIRELRKSAGLTQGDLSEKIGVLQSTIANYESGYSQPENETLSKLSAIFNVSIDYLLGNTTIVKPKEYLEQLLYKCNLNDTEYSLVINNLINTQNWDLSIINGAGKVSNAYKQLYQVYQNYLENGHSRDEMFDISNKNEFTDEEIEKLKKLNEPMDTAFLNLLKSLDKQKIIHKEQSNAFPTIDTPKQYPILGKISAGLPLLAVENIEGYMYAPSSKIQQGYDYFFLKVQRR